LTPSRTCTNIRKKFRFQYKPETAYLVVKANDTAVPQYANIEGLDIPLLGFPFGDLGRALSFLIAFSAVVGSGSIHSIFGIAVLKVFVPNWAYCAGLRA